MLVLDVILPRSFAHTHLSYIYSGSSLPVVGARVEVPLGTTQTAVGVVVAVRQRTQADPKQLKEVALLLDQFPLFPPHTIDLFRFLSSYYIATLGNVLRALVPVVLWRADFAPCEPLRKNRLKKSPPTYRETPALELTFDRSVALVHGVLDFDARIALVAGLHAKGGGQTLIFVPSEQQARIWAKFLGSYTPTLCFHSGLSVKSRADLWVRLATSGKNEVIVATRTGIALPLNNLKQVVVWDEPAHRYKSGTSPHYSARDAALFIAAKHGAQTVLIADVPSVESYFNARANALWQYIELPSDQKPLRWIAPEHGQDLQSKYLMRRVGEELASGGRAIVFQNRRGWSSAWVCNSCGGAVECPWCRTPATLHKSSHTMRCRTCGYRFDEPEACSTCGTVGAFQARGYGTERIAEGLAEQFPAATIVRVDSDTDVAPDAQIVVGTQKLLDEAIDWSGVGVLGVANADNLEVGADFRATEGAFRTLSRLVGRARSVGAELVLQTRQHNQALFAQAIEAHEAFYRSELLHRKKGGYPPFSRLIEFEMRGADLGELVGVGERLELGLRVFFGDRLSPLFEPQSEIQLGKYVVKLLLKLDRGRSVAGAKEQVLQVLARQNISSGVTLEVIVDPQ